MTLSSQLHWNYWFIYHETWYVDRTSYDVVHVGREFWSPHFCGSYAPWNLENIRKSTNNLSFYVIFFINEITASDAGPDIIRSHLLLLWSRYKQLPRKCLYGRPDALHKVQELWFCGDKSFLTVEYCVRVALASSVFRSSSSCESRVCEISGFIVASVPHLS